MQVVVGMPQGVGVHTLHVMGVLWGRAPIALSGEVTVTSSPAMMLQHTFLCVCVVQ